MIPTKIIIPRRPAHLLRRPRLVDRLHRYVDRALMLVSAPAGYGKTTLLTDFAHDAPLTVCWLSLDATDRDLRTFVEYMVAAVRRQFPQFGKVTQRALSTHASGAGPTGAARALAGALIQDLLDNVPDLCAFILDDYHTVDESSEINQLLSTLLTYRPEHLHLILSSRRAPVGLPIIQLTARSQIAGIGSGHLAFTAGEIRDFLAQSHNLNLTAEQAQALAVESEGWITGILLSTQALWRGMRDALAQARTQQAPVYTYLAQEVLAEQPADLRDFLLASSTLAEMNESLCREALGLRGLSDILGELARKGVFVTTVVDETTGTWYRYHHLFRDFLQEQLQTQQLGRFQRLHQQAADWFEAHKEWESAVTHRLKAGDLEAAARTMDQGLSTLFYAGRMETLLAWQQAIPEPLWSKFPRLLLFAGRALINLGRPDEAFSLLSRAEAAFVARGDDERAALAALQQAGVWFIRGQYEDVLTLTHRVLDQAADLPMPAAEAHRRIGLSSLNLGQPQQSVAHLRKALNLYRELGSTSEMAMTYQNLSFALFRLGRLSEAQTYQDKAIEIYRQIGPSDLFAMTLNNVACECYYLTGDYAPALTYLDEALSVAKAAGAPRARAFALLTTADLYRDLGALEQAQALYAQAFEIARRLDEGSVLNFALSGLAQLWLLADEVVEALSLAVQARDHARQREDTYQLGWSNLTLGAVRLVAGDPAAALSDIERGCELLSQSGARRDLTRAYVLLARARQAMGERERALSALEQALELGIETRTFHYLVVEGQRAFELWKALLERNPSDRRPAEIVGRIRALPEVARQIIGGLAPAALPHRPTLRFYGFGTGRMDKDGQAIPSDAWRSALARYLLFYFLVHSPRRRDQIAAIFWPDASSDKAKATFHAVKHQAHHALDRTLINYEDGLYRVELDPDCWFDVDAFESLLGGRDNRQARLEEAVSLYQGDFLEGYDAEWCRPIRERLRLRFRDALVELGEICVDQEQFNRAFVTLNRAIEIDDLHERANQALMRLYIHDGRKHVALEHYRRLERRLQELGTLPSPETQALYQEIQAA